MVRIARVATCSSGRDRRSLVLDPHHHGFSLAVCSLNSGILLKDGYNTILSRALRVQVTCKIKSPQIYAILIMSSSSSLLLLVLAQSLSYTFSVSYALSLSKVSASVQ